VQGAFDILHPGHCEFLEKAQKLGTFLILGLFDDETVQQYKGKGYPVLNHQERVLNTLAMKYVDEVIIGVPWKITQHMIKLFNISIVASSNKNHSYLQKLEDPFAVPK